MIKSKKLNLIGQLLLLLATMVWGTSFVILKDTIAEVPAMFVIAVRFLFAGITLLLVFCKKLKTMTKQTLLSGIIVGLFITGAYLTQTIGLMHTTPGRNAFLTSSYCVMCPFLMWACFKKKPKIKNVVSAIICIVGIGFISLSGEQSSGVNLLLGDGLTLIAAVFFGFQIIFIDHFQKNGAETSMLLTFEFLTTGVAFAIISLIFELPAHGISGYALNVNQILKIAYLAIMCTLFAQSAQMIGQKYTTANQSSIILSVEAVFGMLFSVLVGAEKLSLMLGIGFAIVFVAIMISEINFDSFKCLKKRAGALDNIQENKEKEIDNESN